MIRRHLRTIAVLSVITAVFAVVPRNAWAHAVLVKSTPSANATVHGGDLPITLKFNSRVDGTRSTLQIAAVGGQAKILVIDKQDVPDTLTTHASQLSPGKYVIQWQVLAVDGHITRGQIPFEVK
jgi:copper resistance protein C